MRILPFLVPAASLVSGPTLAQAPALPAPPAPQAPVAAKPLPEKWEDLPAPVRNSFEGRLSKLRFQAVLAIQPAKEPSAEPRMLEAGQFLAVNAVAPARGVRLTAGGKDDAAGELLWQARDAAGDAWCLHRNPNLMGTGRFLCYRDRNDDGVFEELYENAYSTAGAPESSFQTFHIGKKKELKKPLAYAAAEAPARPEIVGLRYKGVRGGFIAPDGHVKPGLVQVELVVGPQPGLLKVAATLDIPLDQAGRGRFNAATGHEIAIEQVEVGGRAKITVTGGLEPGEGYVVPPLTRERVVKMYRAAVQRRAGR